MKVIKSGKPEVKHWWVGKVVNCKNCERQVELEETDEKNPALSLEATYLFYVCENCKAETRLVKSELPEVISEKVQSAAVETTPQSQPAPVGNPVVPAPGNSRPAEVGSKVSYGWNNPFKGTSWGV
jgi:DNA-directed RNA polymerase subunit RPC12/RpoP